MTQVEARERALRLMVPATAEHLRTVRLVAADAAERAGFDFEETADLRIAVDELTHVLMQVTDDPLLLGYTVCGSDVKVRGSAMQRAGGTGHSLSWWSQLILGRVTDSFELLDRDREVIFELTKRHSRTP
ncbi:MAG TPA: hypothetical protein VF441_08320 [Acidimicrobiia bacterium]